MIPKRIITIIIAPSIPLITPPYRLPDEDSCIAEMIPKQNY
jgi:hypothetical protein